MLLAISNNFRWLSTAKEAKILFFVPDTNGEKFLPAHATREIFLSYLSPRLRGFPPFVVLSPAWSKLLFPLELFSHPPFPFRRRARWVLVVRLAEACFGFLFFLVACARFSHQLVGHASCKCRELRLDSRAVRRIWVGGFFYGLGGPNRGVRGLSPGKILVLRCLNPCFFSSFSSRR